MRSRSPAARQLRRPVYLDCNATTPVDPAVRRVMMGHLAREFGNAGSRDHEYGLQARRVVEKARSGIAHVVASRPDEVIFTSGATESNNIALLGLAAHGERTGRRHVVSTAVEHRAVLEPLAMLRVRGFTVELVPPDNEGRVDPEAIWRALRPDTLLVSVMHANNEVGVLQPLDAIAGLLCEHDAYYHVDAAQGFGKDIALLREPRIDLISVSAHKVHGPMGIGALIARRRRFDRPPLQALAFGGGQERGLRPGTLPVALIAGFGEASELAVRDWQARRDACIHYRDRVLAALLPLEPIIHGDPERSLPHVLNLSFSGLDAQAVLLAVKDLIAVSTGSACTSRRHAPSHVLQAMGLDDETIAGAIRISWSHMTPDADWGRVAARIEALR